ncbi:MAG: hypothetical protein J6K03_05830 [Oscillospiraceae bacterium]|nr:hypothetical protein [Oscillospiraceae bacterium]
MKKILIFIFVAALLATLCSCSMREQSPSETEFVFGNNYEVYVVALFEQVGCLTDFTMIDSCLSNAEPPAPSQKTQTIRIDETDHALRYVSSQYRPWNGHVYEYANADDTVNCLYWSDTMELAKVTLDGLSLEEFAHMDQTQYEQWIRTFVAQFSDEDWDSLYPTCSTYFTKYSQNGSSGRNAEGFKADFTENELLRSYNFRYVRHIDSVATTDEINAILNFDFENSTVRITLWFNEHTFDSYTTIPLDMEAIEVALNEFADTHMKNNCTKTKVELTGGLLIHVEGNLMYRCFIDVHWTYSGIRYDCPYSLLVDIPDP